METKINLAYLAEEYVRNNLASVRQKYGDDYIAFDNGANIIAHDPNPSELLRKITPRLKARCNIIITTIEELLQSKKEVEIGGILDIAE